MIGTAPLSCQEMRLLHAGIDTSVIALWPGHENVETTQVYLHADLASKERALARARPAETSPPDSGPPTNFSPFWRRSDYAAFFAAIRASQAGLAALIGIIRSAA